MMRPSGKTVSKRMRKRTCYACPNQATGDDHVPPKFLFPEFADLGHKYGDLRRGLMTVPACDKHNTEQSGDDAYFVISIVPCIRNNEIAKDHFKTKIMRSLEGDSRVAKWYADAIYGCESPVRNAGSLNRESLDRTITKIVKGLYHKITGRKILAEKITGIFYQDLFDNQLAAMDDYKRFETRMNRHSRTWVRYIAGSPRVFSVEYYVDIRNFNRIAFKMQFYQGFQVWAINEGEEVAVGEGRTDTAPLPSG